MGLMLSSQHCNNTHNRLRQFSLKYPDGRRVMDF
jgi:hypothetical protein